MLLPVLVLACADKGRDDDDGGMLDDGAEGITLSAGDDAAEAADDPLDDGGDEDDKLDVGGGTGSIECQEGQVCDECVVQEHTPCDGESADLFQAIGLCPADTTFTGTVDGDQLAMGTRVGFGTTMQWAPREGSKFVVLGSGLITDLDLESPAGDLDLDPTHCNDDLGPEWDKGNALPAPVRVNNVSGDCAADPTLLGSGDCSNTIQGQFTQGMSANDYTEMRIVATVPPSNNSVAYDFAFFSTEYPEYYGSVFNDMYIGWLESESWTGNISFDTMGNPISLNAGFLDFKDDGGNQRPEFDGTCMKRHAGTKWLSTVAPVTPGEEITVVFAIFDLSDSILDSYVFLDNWQWGCEGTDHPTTTPVG